jgi:hypothetical protein
MTKSLGQEYYSIALPYMPPSSRHRGSTASYYMSIILSCIVGSQMAPSWGHAQNLMIKATTICAAGGSDLWNNLEKCGWPGPSNTGPDLSQCPGGILTNNSGPNTRVITISTPGTVISCENITGGLQITAQNVTIKNSIVTYDGGGLNGSGVININDGASATVDHVKINGLNHTHACIWDEGVKGTTLTYSMIAKNVNCYGINDGIFSWWWSKDKNAGAGSDFIIQDSYFHDFTTNAANGHIDGYQTEGAQNGAIIHNTYKMTSVEGTGANSAIALWDSFNQTVPTGLTSGNFTVTNNLIAGGGFAIYAEDYSGPNGQVTENIPNSAVGGNTLTNVTFTNNKFSTILNSCVGVNGIWFYRGAWPPYYGGPTDGWKRSFNIILETGMNVDNGNPAGCS